MRVAVLIAGGSFIAAKFILQGQNYLTLFFFSFSGASLQLQ